MIYRLTPKEQKPFIHKQKETYGDITVEVVDVDIDGLLDAQIAKFQVDDEKMVEILGESLWKKNRQTGLHRAYRLH